MLHRFTIASVCCMFISAQAGSMVSCDRSERFGSARHLFTHSFGYVSTASLMTNFSQSLSDASENLEVLRGSDLICGVISFRSAKSLDSHSHFRIATHTQLSSFCLWLSTCQNEISCSSLYPALCQATLRNFTAIKKKTRATNRFCGHKMEISTLTHRLPFCHFRRMVYYMKYVHSQRERHWLNFSILV